MQSLPIDLQNVIFSLIKCPGHLRFVSKEWSQKTNPIMHINYGATTIETFGWINTMIPEGYKRDNCIIYMSNRNNRPWY